MDWIISTQPVAEPVTLDEMKLHLKVQSEITTDDSLIETLITAARDWCEQYSNRSYVNRTITLKMDYFEDTIQLPSPPLISVTSVKYLDSNGTEQTLAATYYDVFTTCEPGQIRLAYNQTWPTTYDVKHAVRIEYIAGYGYGGASSTITAATKANPCVLSVAAHGLASGQDIYVSSIVDDGPSGDFEEALNDRVFKITYLTAGTFSIPTNTSALTNSYASGGTVTTANLVPSRVKAAIKLLVAHLYEHRTAAIEESLREIPLGVKHLLSIDRNYI